MDYSEEFLKQANKERKRKSRSIFELSKIEYKGVKKLTLSKARFENKTFEYLLFSGCTFTECEFNKVYFEACVFINCVFKNCRITNTNFFVSQFHKSNFKESSIINVAINDSTLSKVSFKTCVILELSFSLPQFEDVIVDHCGLTNVSIASIPFYPVYALMKIINSTLSRCNFRDISLAAFRFENCVITTSVFANVVLGEETFYGKVSGLEKQYSSIDFQSLRNSADIPYEILESIFGIHAPDIQAYTREMLSKIEFHTVFISYSFKDSAFAELINNALLARGVFTFLWKNDAPTGERLKKIMYDMVQKFDKILFIASKNSLKSEACHFELSEGKKKYESTWEEVLFPIHIDNYLFEIKEHEIPRAHRALFYDNILELREIHSKDFSKFLTASLNDPEFNKALTTLIADLRKKS